MKRRISKPIRIGNVTVGGDAPVIVQSMTKTDTRDVMSTIRQIKELEECGCEIIRVAVPDSEAAQAIKKIKRGISIPLVADIHFDYRLALEAIKNGVDGLRLNPGNIGEADKVTAVVKAAKERRYPYSYRRQRRQSAASFPKKSEHPQTDGRRRNAAD